MKLLRVFLFGAACAMSMAASAQWQWIDKDGRKVFSDRPPPADIPEKSILKQPNGSRSVQPDAPAAAAAPASAPASAPKLSGKDKDLEDKKKQAEQADAAKKKAEEAKQASARADNCARAKSGLATLDSGIRIRTTNASGETEYMSDERRAAETSRLQGIISSDCK
jgi:hypothetical protein